MRLLIAQFHISLDLKEWKYYAKCLSPVYLHQNCENPGMHNNDLCYILIKCLWSVSDEYIFLWVCLTRSPSAGKLLNYMIDDGGHVFAGDVYTEIEVMKMVMELRVTENGW